MTDAQCGATFTDEMPYRWNKKLLPYICALVARKFGNDTVDAVKHTLTQVLPLERS